MYPGQIIPINGDPSDCFLQLQRDAQQQSGLSGGLLGGAVGSALWSTRSTRPEPYSNQFQPQAYQLLPQAYQLLPTPQHRMIKFFRVNEKVEVPEGATINEPLDELRIKVAKWLYN